MEQYEYVWLDGRSNLRSKTRFIQPRDNVEELPSWSYDGSSTFQANADNSEVKIVPKKMYTNPFGDGYILMCATYNHKSTPLDSRTDAEEKFNEAPTMLFGLEQEYFICDPRDGRPLGYEEDDVQGRFYCSVGTGNAYGRKLVEAHAKACREAGINISGTNAEVAPGQWEFQIGPSPSIDAADDLWMARYILLRLSEEMNLLVNFNPIVLETGHWNASGCHVNVSTKETMSKEGMYHIVRLIDHLATTHDSFMNICGVGNRKRLTGKNETSIYHTFTWGVADRTASVRIPRETHSKKKGYIEDRRPASNMDPYVVLPKYILTHPDREL